MKPYIVTKSAEQRSADVARMKMECGQNLLSHLCHARFFLRIADKRRYRDACVYDEGVLREAEALIVDLRRAVLFARVTALGKEELR